MNIFEHKSSFLGSLDSEIANDSLLSLFRLARQIRLQLGPKSYLLDCYLSLFFEGVNAIPTCDAAHEGFLQGYELQGLCSHVLDGTAPERSHQLYPRIRKAYEQQAGMLSFQESLTQVFLLMLSLEDELLAFSVEQFVKEQQKNMNAPVDMIHMQELYTQISQLVGEPVMEKLNQQLKKRFLIASTAAVFAQGLTDDLLVRLTSRDPETSRQMFQLFMDGIPDILE